MKQEKSAGAVIYYLENNIPVFLLLKYQTYWGFAKGWIEEGEGEKDAALREIREETGLKVFFVPGFSYEQKWMFRHNGELIIKKAVFFLAEVSKSEAGKVKISEEHEEFKFLSYEDACRIMKVKDNKIMLEKAKDFILEFSKQKKLI